MFVVTGGAGFIGSVVIAELENNFPNTPIAVIDWLEEDDRWKNINKRTVSNIIFPEDTFEFLEDHQSEIKAIIHMGAISTTTETNVNKIVEQNIGYSLDLFDWCTENDIPFIYASSAATYGEGENGFNDSIDPTHLKKLQPLNPYGFSKHMVDKAIIQKNEKPSQWVGLKFFNVYGPNEYHKGGQKSVVAHAFKQIQETGKMKLFKSHHPDYEDGMQLRDFVYVNDIAKNIIWFIKNPQVSGIFNQGTGKARSFKDLTIATFKAMNLPENIEYIDMPENLQNQYQYFTEANMNSFNHVYKKHEGKEYKPTSLEDGVTDYVQNYLLKSDSYI
ncbi:MAG: ADP-glyceromanno-heptose 6-epimerase [Magnetococcales bacterium]|nr:ADP-glyceromanno-heptose 6-epimerase [Magnetococcales bacterium]|tara:strand:- start:1698 stop:2690 length:993 start_codon:yes stop_codon:yes gene_type:complete